MRFEFDELDGLIRKGLAYETIGKMYGVSGVYVKKAYIKLGGVPEIRRKGASNPANKGQRKIKARCRNCHKRIFVYSHPFCSQKCAYEYRSKRIIKKWESHKFRDRKKGYKIPVSIYRHVHDIQDHKCACCHEAMGLDNLIPYFMDGDSLHIEKGNMILICPECYVLKMFQKPNIKLLFSTIPKKF